MKCLAITFLLAVMGHGVVAGQKKIDSLQIFSSEPVIELKLSTDFKRLMYSTRVNDFQPASVSWKVNDTLTIDETIQICARGQFRRENCHIPSTLLDFKTPGSPRLSVLGKLKLVSSCSNNSYNEQLLLKEYLTYKIYNLLTEKSFKVRLLQIAYNDTRNKIKLSTQYAFVIEDLKTLAKRNNCSELKKVKFNTESTDRSQMTLVALFQYMIGNTDWAVPNDHNIRLIQSRKDTLAPPYVIPYDFDYSGLVNANYAIPDEHLGTSSVTERVYRGFPRTMEELGEKLDLFMKKKTEIWSLIEDSKELNNTNKKEMISYLQQFYQIIENKSLVKSTFIDNARTQ